MIALGHEDRPVTFVVRNNRPAVAKRYLNGGAGEAAAVLAALWASPFGAARRPPGTPELVDTDGGTVWMERLGGQAIGARGDLGATVSAGPEVARLLADLHGSGVVVSRERTGAAIVRSCRRKLAEQPPDRRDAFDAAVTVLAGMAPPDGPMVLSHGDFSPRNVLQTESGPRLIDVDRVQMASPSRDVAYWGAWAWATLLLAGDAPSWAIGDAFAFDYAACAPSLALAFDGSGLAFHRGAALVRISDGWSVLADEPEVVSRILAEVTALATAQPREVLRPMANGTATRPAS